MAQPRVCSRNGLWRRRLRVGARQVCSRRGFVFLWFLPKGMALWAETELKTGKSPCGEGRFGLRNGSFHVAKRPVLQHGTCRLGKRGVPAGCLKPQDLPRKLYFAAFGRVKSGMAKSQKTLIRCVAIKKPMGPEVTEGSRAGRGGGGPPPPGGVQCGGAAACGWCF